MGNLLSGEPAKIGRGNDPTEDGNPEDATVLALAETVVANVATNTFVEVPITPTLLSPAGKRRSRERSQPRVAPAILAMTVTARYFHHGIYLSDYRNDLGVSSFPGSLCKNSGLRQPVGTRPEG